MVGARRLLLPAVAALVALVVIATLFLISLTGEEAILEDDDLPRQPKAIRAQFEGHRPGWGELLSDEIALGDVVVVVPADGGLLAEAVFRTWEKDARDTLMIKMIHNELTADEPAAAIRRKDPQLHQWLTLNSRVQLLQGRFFSSIQLPSASVNVVAAGREVHHMGPVERSNFIGEVHRILADGGRFVMLDILATSPSATFLKKFVNAKSHRGYRGHFVTRDESLGMAEAAGFRDIEADEMKIKWEFGGEEEMLAYMSGVFDLGLRGDVESIRKAVKKFLAYEAADDGSCWVIFDCLLLSATKERTSVAVTGLLPHGQPFSLEDSGGQYDDFASIAEDGGSEVEATSDLAGSSIEDEDVSEWYIGSQPEHSYSLAEYSESNILAEEETFTLLEEHKDPEGVWRERVEHAPHVVLVDDDVDVRFSASEETSAWVYDEDDAKDYGGEEGKAVREEGEDEEDEEDEDEVYLDGLWQEEGEDMEFIIENDQIGEGHYHRTMAEAYPYIPHPSPPLALPASLAQASFASCRTQGNLAGDILRTLLQTTELHWKDVTGTLMRAVRAESVRKMGGLWQSFCRMWKTTTPAECLEKALLSKGSPLGDLRVISCGYSQEWRSILSAVPQRSHALRKVLLIGGNLDYGLSEKAHLLVDKLQSAPADVMTRLHQCVPRAYLVAAPCVGKVEDDQWDLWLEDYFGGSSAEAAALSKGYATRYRVEDATSDVWMSPQPAIDKGAQLWISKPTQGLVGPKRNGAAHKGRDVTVVYSPKQYLDEVVKETETNCGLGYRVVQKYVEQPPLWNGFKADLRFYSLSLSSHMGAVDYIYTKDLLVRPRLRPTRPIICCRALTPPSCKRYANNLQTQEGHVTNISKANKEGGGDAGTSWEFYAASLQKVYPELDVRSHILKKSAAMAMALLPLFRQRDPLVAQVKMLTLTAWDIILDRELNVWLMEANVFIDPGLTTSSMGPHKLPLWGQFIEEGLLNDPWERKPERFGDYIRADLL